jgi:hypothetical protein
MRAFARPGLTRALRSRAAMTQVRIVASSAHIIRRQAVAGRQQMAPVQAHQTPLRLHRPSRLC